MSAMTKRRYARYPDCFGRMDLMQLVDCARKHGMSVIVAYKPGLHVHNEIGLYGTAEQMRAVERDWHLAGHALKPRGFRAVLGVDLGTPRESWVDAVDRTGPMLSGGPA